MKDELRPDPGRAPGEAPVDLLERDAALLVLEARLRSAAEGTGHTVLLAGEAGIGKTSLLKTLARRRGAADLWWGDCDALQTPLPLAPLHDIARSAEVPFRGLLSADGNRAALFETVLTELRQAPRARLLVIEDAHWADDATLDLLKFLGRRIDRARCLLVVSYRDDEVATGHPLRRVLGELPRGLVTRVELPRLSREGVELLARRALRSPAGVYSATRGNPFFVTELLTHRGEGIPRSVQDVVLARYARLGTQARAIVELAAVVPAKIEHRLVDLLLGANAPALEECMNSGLLVAHGSALSFRHELARAAIEASLSAPAARALHAGILGILEREAAAFPVSLERLVHHAARAGDRAAVMKYAPRAAFGAQQRGAHREAAAHFRAALDCTADADSREVRAWLEAYARECRLSDQVNEAIAARSRLDEHLARSGDPAAEARNLSELALLYVLALKNAQADAASRRAIELVRSRPADVDAARVYRIEAHIRMLNRDFDAAAAWSAEAIRLAEQFDDRELLALALGTLGTATMFTDYDAGRTQMDRALELALSAERHDIAGGAYTNIGSASGEIFRLREARQYLTTAVAFAERHELACDRNYSMAWLALCELYLGCWDEAIERARDVLETSEDGTTSRVMALVALGRVQARRGEAAVDATLDEALALALASETLQRVAPVRAARAEAAYLRGDLRAVREEAAAALTLATRYHHPWFAGELAYWMFKAGALDALPAACAEPYALQIAGRFRAAAAAWADAGCVYEQARALADGDTKAALEALQLFERIGARPAADALRRTLRTSGVRGLPRGMRASTQANPHELTERELEVLLLLCEGLKNAEIAERLSRSVRTVDHHLAAAFSKLGVSSRTEAMAAAQRAGLRPHYGQAPIVK